MKKYTKILAACLCFCAASAVQAQTGSTEVAMHKDLRAGKEIAVQLVDSTAAKNIYFVAKYQSDKGYSFDISGRQQSEGVYKIGKNLSYYVFEFVFNKAMADSFKTEAAISQQTIHECWSLIWGLNNPGSTSIAGTLLLANQIVVLDNYQDRSSDYNKRRLLREKYIYGSDAVTMGAKQSLKTALIQDIRKNAGKYGRIPFLYDSVKIAQDRHVVLLREVRDNAAVFYSSHLRSARSNSVSPENFSKDTTDMNHQIAAILQLEVAHQTYLDSCRANAICQIKKVELQFERGFIERVKVWVSYRNGVYIFENIYAIGFSSFLNYKSLADIRLYIRNKEFTNRPYIYLSDVIRDYDNRLANYTRDYSPADTAFVADPNTQSDIELPRESFINIFDARIFTDLNGTKKSNPNGLFQIELSKRFNVNTARRQIGSKRADVGYANYVQLFGAVNKIEQNNRYLTLHNANVTKGGAIVSPNYATNLDFTRYENYTAGFLMNGVLFDVPDGKFSLYADLGVKYGYLNIADSVIAPVGMIKNPHYFPEAHTVTFSLPRITLELFSESRINVSASYAHNYTYLFSNNAAKQVASYQKSDLTANLLEKGARRSNMYELAVKLMPTKEKNTHVFARLRFYTQNGDANTSFSQIQLGYAYNWSINR